MDLDNELAKNRREQKIWLRVMIISLLVALILAIIFSFVNYTQGQRRQAAINQLGANYEQLREQKKDLCDQKENAAEPECLSTGESAEKIVKETIERTIQIPGIPGPRGFTGPTGPPGETPSSEFLMALAERAQAQYCSTGVCIPADGKDGKDDTDGTDGTDGISTDGKDGTNGTDGKDGRSITSTQCGDDGRWIVTYSDGTNEDAGTCHATPTEPAHGPTQTPEPTP